MIRVLIESPYAGDVDRNLRYLRACMRDCLLRDEAPFASHALYTQPGVLDDNKPEERSLGIKAGLHWGYSAAKTVVYTDLGISGGMLYGIQRATDEKRPIEYRTLEGWSEISVPSQERGYMVHKGHLWTTESTACVRCQSTKPDDPCRVRV